MPRKYTRRDQSTLGGDAFAAGFAATLRPLVKLLVQEAIGEVAAEFAAKYAPKVRAKAEPEGEPEVPVAVEKPAVTAPTKGNGGGKKSADGAAT